VRPDEHQIHRAVSADGIKIAARVEGHGPSLVLLPAGPGNSEISWGLLLPFLSAHFTCFLLDTRGRGLSEDHPDHSPERLVEDVVAITESIGGPVGMVGWGNGLWARVAAAKTESIGAIAAYEPGANEVMSKETNTRLHEAFSRVADLATAGRLPDAARTFIEHSDVLYTAEELAGGAPGDFWDAAAPGLPVFLREQQLAVESEHPGPTDPSVLARITMPVLLLRGSESTPWFADSVRHVARHLAAPRLRVIPGAGHFGPYTAPEPVANELLRFFTREQRSASAGGMTSGRPG